MSPHGLKIDEPKLLSLNNSRHFITFGFMTWALVGCWPPPGPLSSSASPPPRQPSASVVQTPRTTTDEDLKKLTAQVERLEQGLRQFKADHSVWAEDLRNDLKSFKGEIDRLTFEREQSDKEWQKIRQDIDLRLLDIEKKLTQVPNAPDTLDTSSDTSAPKATPNFPPLSKEQDYFKATLSHMHQSKDYTLTIQRLRAFVSKYPKSRNTPEARYWIGLSYFNLKDYKRSIKELESVAKGNGSRVCDALYYQGRGFSELNQTQEARLFYEEVTSSCPKTGAAQKAAAQLRKLPKYSAKASS